MNSKEQHDHYSQQFEELTVRTEKLHSRRAIGAIQSLEAYSMTLARKILSDLKQKIDAYGEKSYPMSEKQVAVIENALREESTRIETLEKQAQAEEASVIEAEMKAIYPAYDGNINNNDALYRIAKRVLSGKISRFQAKEEFEDRNRYFDNEAACEELFGYEGDGIRHHNIRSIRAEDKLVWGMIEGVDAVTRI